MTKIRRRAERLVDVLKIELCAINSNIVPKESDIASEDWMPWESQHVDRMSDIPKKRAMCRRFRQITEKSNNMPKERTTCQKLRKCSIYVVDLLKS